MDDEISDELRTECGTCVFFKAVPNQKKILIGTCHRYPPQVTRFWSDEDVVEEYAWPQTTRIMWCGEYQSAYDTDDDDALM